MTEQTLPYPENEVTGVGNFYVAFAIEEVKSRGTAGDALQEVFGFSVSYDRDTHPHVKPCFEYLEREQPDLFLEAVDIGYRLWDALRNSRVNDISELRPQMENIIGHALWILQNSGDPELVKAAKQVVI